MGVLTGIDILGIQRFVFASNRLRDVVSASWLVHWATSRDGALRDCQDQHVPLAAGGAAILEFESLEEAKKFAGRYTRSLLESAPGLEAVIAHRPYQHGWAEALRDLQVHLARKKLERTPNADALGMSVTAACQVTGFGACAIDRLDGIPISKQVELWRRDDVRRAAEKRWQADLPKDSPWQFPVEIDELGRTWGDTSLLGVVHIDANDMGEGIREWLNQCIARKLNSATVRAQCREWSQWLDQHFQGVWQGLVRRVLAATQDRKVIGSIPELSFDLRAHKLPLRPVLLGGDDLTFLCDGRIALDLAAAALRAFGDCEAPHLGKISACAGVAVVRAHHPFARAYELAEQLCANAKTARKMQKDAGCWFDWHVGAIRPGEPISQLRDRTYRTRDLALTCRPYRLGSGAIDVGSWRWFSETVLGTSGNGLRAEAWRQRRNKVKSLAALIREGPDAVRGALGAWRAVDRTLALPERLGDSGYVDGHRTPLLDATELLDIHLPLEAAS